MATTRLEFMPEIVTLSAPAPRKVIFALSMTTFVAFTLLV